jgi:hypothetical protein
VEVEQLATAAAAAMIAILDIEGAILLGVKPICEYDNDYRSSSVVNWWNLVSRRVAGLAKKQKKNKMFS